TPWTAARAGALAPPRPRGLGRYLAHVCRLRLVLAPGDVGRLASTGLLQRWGYPGDESRELAAPGVVCDAAGNLVGHSGRVPAGVARGAPHPPAGDHRLVIHGNLPVERQRQSPSRLRDAPLRADCRAV